MSAWAAPCRAAAHANGFTAYGENRVVSFDPVTGALAPGAARQSPGDVWATHMELLGMTESDFSMYGVDGRPITAVIDQT